MSARLMVLAGYVNVSPSHKLALMKVCDSADERNRLGFPGLDVVRIWADVGRSRALELLQDLQEWGLLMHVERGRRGRRAVYKVFPDPGDEAFSVSAKEGKPCPGAERFEGLPEFPETEDDISDLLEKKGPVRRTQKKGSDAPDPNTEGSGQQDPNDPGKGPAQTPTGSGVPDPFGTNNFGTYPHPPSGGEGARADAHARDEPDSEPAGELPIEGLASGHSGGGKTASKARGGGKRARPWPEGGWRPTAKVAAWAQKAYPTLNLDVELEAFTAYYTHPDQRRKTPEGDWNARWKEWLKRAQAMGGSTPPPTAEELEIIDETARIWWDYCRRKNQLVGEQYDRLERLLVLMIREGVTVPELGKALNLAREPIPPVFAMRNLVREARARAAGEEPPGGKRYRSTRDETTSILAAARERARQADAEAGLVQDEDPGDDRGDANGFTPPPLSVVKGEVIAG